MEALDRYKQTLKQLSARVFGTKADQPRYLSGQVRNTSDMSTLVALPQIKVAAIQDQDSASAGVGAFYYMLDYDPIDGDREIH